MPKVKKMTQALQSGELPETLVQCLVDHGLNCPKYMNLSFQTLTSWAKHLDKVQKPSKLCLNTYHSITNELFQPPLFCRRQKGKRMVRNDVFGDEISRSMNFQRVRDTVCATNHTCPWENNIFIQREKIVF